MEVLVPSKLLQSAAEDDMAGLLKGLFDAQQESLWCWAATVTESNKLLNSINKTYPSQTIRSLWPCMKGIGKAGATTTLFKLSVSLYSDRNSILCGNDSLARLAIAAFSKDPAAVIPIEFTKLLLRSTSYVEELLSSLEERYHNFYRIIDSIPAEDTTDRLKLLLSIIVHCVQKEYFDDATVGIFHFGVLTTRDPTSIRRLINAVKELPSDQKERFFDELEKKALYTDIGVMRTTESGSCCVIEADTNPPTVIMNCGGASIRKEEYGNLKSDNTNWKLVNDVDAFKEGLLAMGKTCDDYKIDAVTEQVYGELWSDNNERCGIEDSNGKFYYSDDAEFTYPTGFVKAAYPSLFFFLLQLWTGKYTDSITNSQWELISEVQPNFR
eukprot:TRINITY_DN19504_c0_g1_i2.p1 TRINITY_DN19504_c0_g1~~TRINITY_DN19504_c0_g1_i2.p1  ORF type:complete len:395 (+),score=87.57 TRINITY_DN19504_c0_g1_i2:37-1185(+)